MNSSVKWDWILFLKKQAQAGQVARWLIALVALVGDPGSTSSIHTRLTTISNSSTKGSDALFWYFWVPTTHVVHIHGGKTLANIKYF